MLREGSSFRVPRLLLDENHQQVPEGARSTEALFAHWQGPFQAMKNDSVASRLVKTFAPRLRRTEAREVTEDMVCEAVRRRPSTAPGPDGVPLSAYKALGPQAFVTLAQLSNHVRGSRVPLAGSEVAIFYFYSQSIVSELIGQYAVATLTASWLPRCCRTPFNFQHLGRLTKGGQLITGMCGDPYPR